MDSKKRKRGETASENKADPYGETSQSYDIVAQIPHNRITDVQQATFKRHRLQNRSAGYVYSIDLPDRRSDNVVTFGKECQTSVYGYDYAVAVVNKRTGLADFVPVKLVTFEGTYSSDPTLLLGIKPPPKVDYEVDNASTTETWAEKRRTLTTEFGSAKKIKMQESANRRQIKDETLKTMMDNSALFAPGGVEDQKAIATPISLLVKSESSVLPKPNDGAKTPREVYSWNLFFSETEVAALKTVALEFMKRPKEELINAGFSDVVFRLGGDVGENGKRAVFVVLLAVMVSCYKLVAKPSKRCIMENEWVSLPYPADFATKMRELFFTGEFSKVNSRGSAAKAKMNVNMGDKDKLLAHLLCLILMLDTQNMCIPVTPWAKELTCPDSKIAKLASALGCSVTSATPAEGVRLGTIHIARLIGPPVAKKSFKRKR